MIKYWWIFFSFTFCGSVVMATPKKMEMIFLSPKKIVMTIELLEHYQLIKHSKQYAENEMHDCLPMGDGCFHPQYGFIENDSAKKNIVAKPTLLEERKLELKNFNAIEMHLIDCDKNNYFDIFCGKEGPPPPVREVEIWFDVSSSLKSVDYNKDPDYCGRRSFMEKVIQGCKGKVNISIYNTSLKQMGDYASVCMNYGTNDQAKMLKWMRASEAKYLLMVTDVDEMSREMRDFLEANGAKIVGDGVKAFTSDDLIDYAKDFIKMCH